MAVYRVERTRDYTVMSNCHLKDTSLSLKAKGLLSMMLSLPNEWNYNTRGLAAICKEGVDAIGSGPARASGRSGTGYATSGKPVCGGAGYGGAAPGNGRRIKYKYIQYEKRKYEAMLRPVSPSVNGSTRGRTDGRDGQESADHGAD